MKGGFVLDFVANGREERESENKINKLKKK